MNAIQLLKNEQETAKRMFGQIQAASAAQRGELWVKLEPELNVHEQIEEAALYGPVAQEVGSTEETLEEWREHHHEELREAGSLIREIGGLDFRPRTSGSRRSRSCRRRWSTTSTKRKTTSGRESWVWDEAKLEQAGQQMETLKRQKMPRAA